MTFQEAGKRRVLNINYNYLNPKSSIEKKNKSAPEKKQETDGLLPAATETEDKNSEDK